MGQIWRNLAMRLGAADRMARAATGAHEYVEAPALHVILWRARLLTQRVEPAFEIRLGLGDHLKRHVCMLNTAEFGALTSEHTRVIGLHPDGGGIAGNQIALALQVWQP